MNKKAGKTLIKAGKNVLKLTLVKMIILFSTLKNRSSFLKKVFEFVKISGGTLLPSPDKNTEST